MNDSLINLNLGKMDTEHNLELMFQIEDEEPINVMKTSFGSITFVFSGNESIEYKTPDGRVFKLFAIKKPIEDYD